MRTEAISHVGLVRKGNEDSYLINSSLGLFVVADGMGGHEAGEVASKVAVKSLERTLTQAPDGETALRDGILAANSEIFGMAQADSKLNGMGTTLTAVYYHSGKVLIGHVGDSRAYLIRNFVATLLTRDHSLVNELVQSGHITEEEALNHPQRHVVTRALGIDPMVEIDLLVQEIKAGDRLVLCTDGLSNLVSAEEIAETFNHSRGTDNRGLPLERLKQLALERGGYDNLTAVLIEF